MKVLAKLGLVTAAAATVLFIFIYEFQGPMLNKVMAQPPSEQSTTAETNKDIQKIEPTIDEVEKEEVVATNQTVDTEAEAVPENLVETNDVIEKDPIAISEPVKEEKVISGPTRNVYGKITLSTSGELLAGVNIMVPGSTVAKISNANGGYTIEVPENARELVFIYRGKKLVQRINSGESLLNVNLDLEKMQYD